MTNEIESATWATIHELCTLHDPSRRGWAIDAGAGAWDYYFEWFYAAGYRTVLIEPLPNDQVLASCRERGISLLMAALGSEDGVQPLYTMNPGDLHSTQPGLWGAALTQQSVVVMTLQTLIESVGVERITALKLDIEGAEPAVIAQLPLLPTALLPAVLSFEFGGVWTLADQEGPWSTERCLLLEDSLRTLSTLGYERIKIIASAESYREEWIALEPSLKVDQLFTPGTAWGNIVAERGGL